MFTSELSCQNQQHCMARSISLVWESQDPTPQAYLLLLVGFSQGPDERTQATKLI